MLNRFRQARMGRRLSAIGTGFVDTFIRDNRVIPPVLAVLALFIFAWIVAGSLIGGPDEEPVSNRAGEVVQSAAAQPSPEVDAPDVDSYAAYQSKDPFRELLQRAGETTEATTGPPEDTTEDTGFQDGDGGVDDGTGAGGGIGRDGREDTTRRDGREDTTRRGGREDTTRRGDRERTGGLFDSSGNLPAPRPWGPARP